MTHPVAPDSLRYVRRFGQAWRCGAISLDLSQPRVMGVLNVTPDSFFDGGRFFERARAVEQGQKLVEEGADILDVGGESTRPGARSISEAEEIDRVVPVIDALRRLCGEARVPISIDTTKPGVMRAAIGAGASLVNDVNALRASGAIDAIADTDAGVCLMHMQGTPATMQLAPTYGDVVAEVRAFLSARATACISRGIAADRIAIDPGFGFGKTFEHNLALLRNLSALATLGFPIVAGLSRKSTIGRLIGRNDGDRLAGSLSAAIAAVARGAHIVRVHDVRETVDALRVWQAAMAEKAPAADELR